MLCLGVSPFGRVLSMKHQVGPPAGLGCHGNIWRYQTRLLEVIGTSNFQGSSEHSFNPKTYGGSDQR